MCFFYYFISIVYILLLVFFVSCLFYALVVYRVSGIIIDTVLVAVRFFVLLVFDQFQRQISSLHRMNKKKMKKESKNHIKPVICIIKRECLFPGWSDLFG